MSRGPPWGIMNYQFQRIIISSILDKPLLSNLAINKIYHKIKNRKTNELLLNQEKTRYEMVQLQEIKLEKLLVHAYQNVPFYTEQFKRMNHSTSLLPKPEFFSQLPILTKKIINDNRKLLLSRELKNNKLIPNSTSGSTGEALYLYYDKRSAAYRRATVVRNQQWIDIDFYDKKAVLWGAPLDLKKTQTLKGRLLSRVKNQIFLSSYELSKASLLEYTNLLNTFEPKLLVSYPGPLSVFSELIIEKGISIPSIKAIISSAETLFPWQKEIIEKAFSCPVYNRYGCREFGDIAQECVKREGLHINADRFLVEIVDSQMNPVNGEDIGELLITDLDNYGMPLIRYRIGDMACFEKAHCSCGMSFPLLKKIEGRTLDVVRAPNGNKLGGTFWTLLLRSRKSFKAFQVVQDSLNEISINYVRSNVFMHEDLKYYENKIIEKCGSGIKICFNEVSLIPETISGKTRIVISNI